LTDVEPVIGIDLGTTNSCVAVVRDGEVHVIPDEHGERIQASVVTFLSDDSVLVGNEAREEAVNDPENTVYSAKRLIGRAYSSKEVTEAREHFPFRVVKGRQQEPFVQIRSQRYAVPEISGMVLRRMKDIAEQYLGSPVSKAVVTVPANFNDGQRQMTRLAGELAGLEVIRIINEPTAAALAYGYGHDVDARLAVYDFGGGTFDATILEIKGNVFEVVSTAGDGYLGGDDFDNRLTRYMKLAFEKQHGFSIENNVAALNRLRQVAERTKCELTRREKAIVQVRELAEDADGKLLDLRFQIDRESFNQRCEDIVQRSFLVCDEALRDARMRASDIDEVVMVGGTTKNPLVQSMVQHYFGQAPLDNVNPDEVVAVGAAIQGAALNRDHFVEGHMSTSPLLLDVAPKSLGVQTVGGIFDVLIPRNAPIPTEQTRLFTTTVDEQTHVRLRVYQGEYRQVNDNTWLGEVELYGIRSAPRGQVEIEVSFEIDANGIVIVTAKDRETGIEQATRITVTAGYDPEDVAAMKERSLGDGE
jgi:molecular chaperone DnaK